MREIINQNKINKSIIRKAVCILVCICLTGLTGCSLAVKGVQTEGDRLCGAYLTIDKEVDMINTTGIDGKLSIESTVQSEESYSPAGIVEGSYSDHSVRFNGAKGYFVGFIPIEEGGEKITESDADKGYTDVKYNISESDTLEENNGEATFLVPSDGIWYFRVYPVYRRSNGTFYAMTTNSSIISYAGVTTYTEDDTASSVHFESTVTNSIDGEISKSIKDSIKISIKYVDKVEKLQIKEMSQSDEVILTTEVYNQGEDTIKYKVSPDTSYVIVEELRQNKDKTEYTFRSIYSLLKNADPIYHQCNFPGEEDSIGAKVIEISK